MRTRVWRRCGDAIALAVVCAVAAPSCVGDLTIVPISGVDPGCEVVQPPGPPEGSSGDGDVEVVVAVYTLDFGESAGESSTVGLDLDGSCSCDGGLQGCQSNADASEICDGPGGRDNGVARLFGVLNDIVPDTFDSVALTQGAREGQGSLLIRISGYNGGVNDPDVDVALYPSPGYTRDPCYMPGDLPLWDGMDLWPISEDAVAAGPSATCSAAAPSAFDTPRYRATRAYVTDGVLVAEMPSVSFFIPANGDEFELSLASSVLSARLDARADGVHLDQGVIGGRWPLETFFTLASGFRDGDTPICQGHPIYELMKTQICNQADLRVDGVDPDAPCDAVSFGIAFEARPARLGRVVASPPPSTLAGCPASTDPANDGC